MDFDNSKIALAKAENEALITDPKAAKKRKRADKRRRRKYKFTNKKHSRLGIAATVIAVFAIAAIVLSIVIATSMKGEAGDIVGLLPFAAIAASTIGIVLSGITFRKGDLILTFSWIGIISNIVIWLFVAFMVVIGI